MKICNAVFKIKYILNSITCLLFYLKITYRIAAFARSHLETQFVFVLDVFAVWRLVGGVVSEQESVKFLYTFVVKVVNVAHCLDETQFAAFGASEYIGDVRVKNETLAKTLAARTNLKIEQKSLHTIGQVKFGLEYLYNRVLARNVLKAHILMALVLGRRHHGSGFLCLSFDKRLSVLYQVVQSMTVDLDT
jgi:hypothetical protein